MFLGRENAALHVDRAHQVQAALESVLAWGVLVAQADVKRLIPSQNLDKQTAFEEAGVQRRAASVLGFHAPPLQHPRSIRAFVRVLF